MNALPTMIIVWALCTAVFVALMVYRGHLTRHEIDTVFLNENVDHDHAMEHAALVRRVNRIHPFVKTAGGAAVLLAVGIVGIYVANILPQVHF